MYEAGLKVLHIAEGFDGGVVTFFRHVLPALRARGIEVSLICSPRRGEAQCSDLDDLLRYGVGVHLIRMSRHPNPIRDVAAIASIVRLLREEAPSVVHTHCFKAGLVGRIAARIVGGMVIMHTPHCFPFMRTDSCFVNWVCQATERYLGLGSQCLTLVSQSQRHAADESGIADLVPCEVIPNGLPISRRVCDRDRASLLKELGLPTDCLVVGTVCRLVNYKCVEHFVRAANIVQRHIPRTVFLVAGDGPLRTHLTRLVRRLCLSGHIRFIGYRSDVETILRLLDVCVLCSRAEGMPYVLLEAMVAGVPIVASAVHGNTDLIEDGRTGLLYEFGRVDQLAEKLVHCLADASLRTKLSHEAKHYVLCRHRLDDQVDQMAELYRDLVYQAEMRREKVAQGVHLRTPSAVGGGSYR